jgi:hypothetical protein
LVNENPPALKLAFEIVALQSFAPAYVPESTREPLEPKLRVPEKVAAIVPDVSASVAATLVKEIPLTLKVPLVTLAVQLFAAR